MVRIEVDELEVEGETMAEAKRALRKAQRAKAKETERHNVLSERAAQEAYATIGYVAAFPHLRWDATLPTSPYFASHVKSENFYTLVRADRACSTEPLWVKYYDVTVLALLEQCNGDIVAVKLKCKGEDEPTWEVFGVCEDRALSVQAGAASPLFEAMLNKPTELETLAA